MSPLNIESIDLVELNATEMEKTEGGFLPMMTAAAAWIIWYEMGLILIPVGVR